MAESRSCNPLCAALPPFQWKICNRTLKILGSRQIFFLGEGSGFATAWQFVQVLCQAPSAAVHVSLVAMLREDRAGALNWVGLAGSLAMLSSVVIAHRYHLVTSVDVMRLLFRHQRLLQNRFGLMPSWGMAPADIVDRVRSLQNQARQFYDIGLFSEPSFSGDQDSCPATPPRKKRAYIADASCVSPRTAAMWLDAGPPSPFHVRDSPSTLCMKSFLLACEKNIFLFAWSMYFVTLILHVLQAGGITRRTQPCVSLLAWAQRFPNAWMLSKFLIRRTQVLFLVYFWASKTSAVETAQLQEELAPVSAAAAPASSSSSSWDVHSLRPAALRSAAASSSSAALQIAAED